MSTQKELADALAKAVRKWMDDPDDDADGFDMYQKLRAYEATAQPEAKPVPDWMAEASVEVARWAYGYYNAGDSQREALAYWDGAGRHLPGPKFTVEVVRDIIAKHAPQPSQEVTVDEIRQWLLRQTASTPEGYVRSWHFALLDMEKAINAIKAERAAKSQAAKKTQL